MKLRNLVVGLLAGASFGLLFAPKKGKELREKIKKEINEGGVGIGEFKEAIEDSAVEMIHWSKKLWNKGEKFIEEKSSNFKSDKIKKSKKSKK